MTVYNETKTSPSPISKTSKTPSKTETIKIESNYLRGTIADELLSDDKKFSNTAEQLLKFHGMYQQKDRDRRPPEQRNLGPKPFTLMVRGRIAGGRLTTDQWLVWDRIADLYSTEGLRITTRQSLQLHGILKENVKETIQEINRTFSSTTGACGDVVRNVIQAVNPSGDPKLSMLDEVSETLSSHFEVRSRAYAEVFLDGAPQHEPPEDIEPIYGRTYLPRKFKIAVTIAGDNSIDLYAQDLTFVATFKDADIEGYYVYVGGGMGLTHNKPETYARLASYLGWVPASGLLPVAEAVVTTQRDYGDRADRSHARLKYTIDDYGLHWFKEEVQSRSGFTLALRREPQWKTPSYLGWVDRTDGTLALGFHTLSGRLKDTPGKPLKSTLREIIKTYQLGVQLTPEQDIILLGIRPEHKHAIETLLTERHLSWQSPSRLYDRALTCVALPMCSKALAEGERVGPDLFEGIDHLLSKYDLSERAPTVRITGCPNGCARPYAAEIGLVGQMPGRYALYLGGHPEGIRLGIRVMEKVKFEDIHPIIDRLFHLWATAGKKDEGLGDFVQRYPRDDLLAALDGSANDGVTSSATAEVKTRGLS